MNRSRIFFGISLITLSVLMLELSLTRLFSATMYYHFAFMAISLALFGSGASGVFVYVIQRGLKPEHTGRWLSFAAMSFALSNLFSLYVILSNPLTFETGPENYYRLAKIYGAAALPFFFAGCAVTLAITRLASEISKLYLFDLAGAALGCLLLIPVLNFIGAINIVLLVSALGALAGVLFGSSKGGGRVAMICSLILTAGIAGLVAYNSSTHRIDIRRSKGFEEKNVLFSKWNSFSRITVEGDFDNGVDIKIDADAATGISKDASNSAIHQDARDSLSGLVHRLKHDANVLIIGPGGGNDVMTARVFGQKQITAVEINPIIARDVMSSEPFKSYSGSIYQQRDVRLVVDEGRSFIRSSRDRYDIIQATMVDTWAATAAGAFSLSENNLYTVEAFKDYVMHLTDDGLLTMTRWYFEPPDQLLRLISLTRTMMSELGISNPGRHIMLVRDAQPGYDRTPATFIFRRSEFTDDDVRSIEAAAETNDFQLLFTPLTRPPNVFTQLIEAPNPAQFWSTYETNIEPTRDNNPFFFNTVRLSNIWHVIEGTSGEWQKTNLGTSILFALLGITSVLVLLFIIGPLVLVRGRALATGAATKVRYLLYFACLGAGFIIVEVAMIQKFILFLGHPVYSLAVVLFSVLAFSAAGSYLSGRFPEERLPRTLSKVLAVLAVLVLVYVIALPPIFYGLVHLAREFRIVIAVLLMAPLAMLMGMPMPMGIRILARSVPEIIPWAWGVNGATSVMGSVAALTIAILTGFNQTLVIGAALYLIAIAFSRRTRAVSKAVAAVEGKVEELIGAASEAGPRCGHLSR
jgi:predicted membrane-bound spermidine synthase